MHDRKNDVPDILYILYKYVLVFNHIRNELTHIEMLGKDEKSSLEELESALENRNFASYNFTINVPTTSTITDE